MAESLGLVPAERDALLFNIFCCLLEVDSDVVSGTFMRQIVLINAVKVGSSALRFS